MSLKVKEDLNLKDKTEMCETCGEIRERFSRRGLAKKKAN